VITIYGTSQCGFCKLAIEFAKKKNLEYTFKNIELNGFFNELKTKKVDMEIMPHIWENDRYIGTFKDFLSKYQYPF
jgi:glutaredoxin